MEYDVCEGVDKPSLIRAVQRKIDDGWEPIGSVSPRAEDGRLYQAMVRRPPQPTKGQVRLKEPKR